MDHDKSSTLQVIGDIPVTLSLEVGKTAMPIRQLLNLTPGMIVTLDKAAKDPLEVYVNGTLIAHAEVVIVNEKFGVRLMDVIGAEEAMGTIK